MVIDVKIYCGDVLWRWRCDDGSAWSGGFLRLVHGWPGVFYDEIRVGSLWPGLVGFNSDSIKYGHTWPHQNQPEQHQTSLFLSFNGHKSTNPFSSHHPRLSLKQSTYS
jgi:hypothetical protein